MFHRNRKSLHHHHHKKKQTIRNRESTKQRLEKHQRNQPSSSGTSSSSAVDRLSDLPEPIIHQILLCLPLADAASTKALSRRWWQSIWASCPILYFDEYFFGAEEDSEKRKRFIAHLEESLQKQKQCTIYNSKNNNYNIDKFGLRVSSPDGESVSVIDEWVSLALERNVKELDLRINRYESGSFGAYRLVDAIFVAKTVTVLFLENCKIEPNCSSINLPCLKKLALIESEIEESVFNSLILGSPLIEYLCVEFCEGLYDIEEVSIPNLKSMKLNFSGLDDVVIKSPRLQSVEWSGDFDAASVDLVSLGTIKDLTLKNLDIDDEDLGLVLDSCPLLESLVIDGSIHLTRIELFRTCLKRFVMVRCKRLEEAVIYSRNLVSFEYSGHVMLFSLDGALGLRDAKLVLDPPELNDIWYIWLRHMLLVLAHSKNLTLVSRSDQAIIFPGEFSEDLLPPVRALKHLKLEISSISTNCSTIVDGLLWIFPGLKTINIKSGTVNRLIKV